MPQIRIPDLETRSFKKPSAGEIYGNLWATRNVDLRRNKGKITPAERLYRIVDEGDVATMEIPVCYVRTNADVTDRWWALTQKLTVDTNDGLLLYSTDSTANSAWAIAAVGSDPTDCVDDMCIFGSVGGYDRLVVARDTDLAMLNQTWTASWWDTTLAQAALSNDYPHIVHQFLNFLIVTDGNVAHTIDDSLVVVASRIVLPAEYVINWIANDGLRVYFGTKHKRGGEALVFPWDGTSEKYDEPIPVMSDISFAGVAKNGILHIVNGIGQLLKLNGLAFEEEAHFPIMDKPGRWYFNQTDSVSGGRGIWNTVLHHNGMDIIDGNIHILIAAGIGGASANPYANFPSGIWEYDEDIGLYCKYALGNYDGTTDDDFGGIGSIATAGALKRIPAEEGRLIAGAAVYTNNAANKYNVAMIGKGTSGSGRGYFITAEINTSDFMAFWKRIKLAFRKMDNSTDRIVAKYRTEKDTYFTEDNRNTITATWTSTTTFTTTSTEFAYAVDGDEVEVMCGKGAGAVVHISGTPSYANPTYTVTIDEAITGVTGNSFIRIRNWKKLGSVSDQSINKKIYSITKRSKFVQLKVELRGNHLSPEIEEILIDYNESKR